jgi:hypothetical protein
MLRNLYLYLYLYLYFYSSARWQYRRYSLGGSRRHGCLRGNIPGSADSRYRHKLAYCPDTVVLAPPPGPGLVLTRKD